MVACECLCYASEGGEMCLCASCLNKISSSSPKRNPKFLCLIYIPNMDARALRKVGCLPPAHESIDVFQLELHLKLSMSMIYMLCELHVEVPALLLCSTLCYFASVSI